MPYLVNPSGSEAFPADQLAEVSAQLASDEIHYVYYLTFNGTGTTYTSTATFGTPEEAVEAFQNLQVTLT